jgi:hypothetical protein
MKRKKRENRREKTISPSPLAIDPGSATVSNILATKMVLILKKLDKPPA